MASCRFLHTSRQRLDRKTENRCFNAKHKSDALESIKICNFKEQKSIFIHNGGLPYRLRPYLCEHCPIFPYLTCHLAPFPLFIDVCKKEPTFLVFVYKINIFYGDTMKMRRCWRNHITHACLILKSTVNEEEKQFHINRSCVSYGEYL